MNHYFPGIGIITLIMEQTPDSAQPTPRGGDDDRS